MAYKKLPKEEIKNMFPAVAPKKRGRPRGVKVIKPVQTFTPAPPLSYFAVPRSQRAYQTLEVGDCEILNLNGGETLDVGDVFYHIVKMCVKKIEKTSDIHGSSARVHAEITHKSWQVNKPFN